MIVSHASSVSCLPSDRIFQHHSEKLVGQSKNCSYYPSFTQNVNPLVLIFLLRFHTNKAVKKKPRNEYDKDARLKCRGQGDNRNGNAKPAGKANQLRPGQPEECHNDRRSHKGP